MGTPNAMERTSSYDKRKINKRALGINDKSGRDTNKYTCICCGETKTGINFYKATGSLVWNTEDQVSMLCKDCVAKLFEHYKEEHGDRVAVIIICHLLDLPYEPHIFEAAMLKLEDKSSFNFSNYVTGVRSNQYSKSRSFADSIANGEIVLAARNGGIETGDGLDIPLEPDEMITKSSDSQVAKSSDSGAWTKEEVQNKRFVVSTVGYDPFTNLEMALQDLKFCYNVMASYCDTDGIQGDGHKLQAGIELTLTQLQSRKINELIQKEMCKAVPNEGILKTLSETKQKFQAMISTIADDNKFASGYNANSQAGKHTFTGKMKELSENDFEPIKVNLYDTKTSKAMKQIADLSNRAILDQLALDANDYVDMLREQREMIVKLQARNDHLEERTRQLNNKLEIMTKGKKGR
ncbi:MAG: hypothetical protein IIW69_00975 [Bacteroidaceae bacterium]|nr:hypothetical protein [Bacteroidaceae bacterium]